MKRLTTICAFGLVALVPATAVAAPSSTDRRNASQECRALKAAMGAENFRNTYGTNRNKRNAFGKCVSRQARDEQQEGQTARRNASQQCRAERSDPNFAANHGDKTFEQHYGTNRNGNNAFGKCVSSRARENEQQADEADRQRVNASRQCRAEKRDNPQGFAQTYGSRPNAFGKCVSAKARAQNDQPQPS